jgi:hypothetical protein
VSPFAQISFWVAWTSLGAATHSSLYDAIVPRKKVPSALQGDRASGTKYGKSSAFRLLSRNKCKSEGELYT